MVINSTTLAQITKDYLDGKSLIYINNRHKVPLTVLRKLFKVTEHNEPILSHASVHKIIKAAEQVIWDTKEVYSQLDKPLRDWIDSITFYYSVADLNSRRCGMLAHLLENSPFEKTYTENNGIQQDNKTAD